MVTSAQLSADAQRFHLGNLTLVQNSVTAGGCVMCSHPPGPPKGPGAGPGGHGEGRLACPGPPATPCPLRSRGAFLGAGREHLGKGRWRWWWGRGSLRPQQAELWARTFPSDCGSRSWDSVKPGARSFLGVSHRVQGSKPLSRPPLLSQLCEQGAGWETEQPGLEPALTGHVGESRADSEG